MNLIHIVPNKAGKISAREGDSIRLTREVNVISFMNHHTSLSKDDQFLETGDLLDSVCEILNNLIQLSFMLNQFSKFCKDIGSSEVQAISSHLESLTSVFLEFRVGIDKEAFMLEYTALPHDDLRHGETCKLYQRKLNLSNVYAMIIKLANRLAYLMMPQFDEFSPSYELCSQVYQMTEEVRYAQS